MIKQHNGAFLVNDTAANDPACQAAMQSYMDQLKREAAQRKAMRDAADQGIEFPSWGPAMGQWGHWNISDRD